MARKGESIYKRNDGRWEARYIKGKDAYGKSLYGYVYAKGYLLVKEKRNTIMLKGIDNSNESSMEVSDVVVDWLALNKEIIRESSYQTYQGHIKNHIIPAIGNLKVSKLVDKDIEVFLKDKLVNGRLDGKGGLSGRTVKEIQSVLRQALLTFDSKIFLHFTSLKMKLPIVKPEINVITYDEQVKLLENIDNQSLKLAIILGLYCGLRIGEICALTTQDIDIKKQLVSISKTLYRVQQDDGRNNTKIVIAPTKTYKGNRTIPIPNSIMTILKTHIKFDGYFIHNNGKPLEPRLLSYHLSKIVKDKLKRRVSFHTFRHTFASRCIEAGFDYNILSDILGHTNASTTMNIYVHTNMSRKIDFMNRLTFNSSQ